jgi:hypothetical protein
MIHVAPHGARIDVALPAAAVTFSAGIAVVPACTPASIEACREGGARPA